MSTLSLESHRTVSDVPLDEGVASEPVSSRQGPQGRNDRFLTLFAIATVATIPAAILIGLGYYLDIQEIVYAGVIFFLIASVLWLVAYLMVASWIVSDVTYFIGKFVASTFKSDTKRNTLE